MYKAAFHTIRVVMCAGRFVSCKRIFSNTQRVPVCSSLCLLVPIRQQPQCAIMYLHFVCIEVISYCPRSVAPSAD